MLVNVYTAQGGDWSITAIMSVALVSLCLLYMLVSVVIYEGILLARLRRRR